MEMRKEILLHGLWGRGELAQSLKNTMVIVLCEEVSKVVVRVLLIDLLKHYTMNVAFPRPIYHF